MAIVSLTERVCVRERRWVTSDEFMHGLAFGQLLGPFSLNVCTFVGYQLRGIVGGVVASVAFITPSFLLVTLLSWFYFRFHELPQLQSALGGTNPVIIALIVVAAIAMGRKQVRSRTDWLVAVLAFCAAAFTDVSSIVVLLAAAVWSLGRSWYRREHS